MSEAEEAALRALAKEVSGCWTAFEYELRQAMGYTNYAVVSRKIAACEAAAPADHGDHL